MESYRSGTPQVLAHDLAEERRLRERAEVSESQIRQAILFKETWMLETTDRATRCSPPPACCRSRSRATASTEVRSALEECQGRLHLLAKVHEMLCADSTQKISMPTLLQTVADALRQSFAEMSGRVTLRVTCDEMVLAADDAIPLALLANEIMTNAYKHAFPEQRSGVIAVNLMSAAGNSIVLRIMDNGIGIRSEGADSSLGLKLVRSFAQQLRGAVAFEKPPSASGTVVRLSMQCPTRVQSMGPAEANPVLMQPANDPGLQLPHYAAPNKSDRRQQDHGAEKRPDHTPDAEIALTR